MLVREGSNDGAIWLCRKTTEDLRAAARTLTSRSEFPKIR
jgi:hypothetical protein